MIGSNSISMDRIIQDDSKVGKILHSVVFLLRLSNLEDFRSCGRSILEDITPFVVEFFGTENLPNLPAWKLSIWMFTTIQFLPFGRFFGRFFWGFYGFLEDCEESSKPSKVFNFQCFQMEDFTVPYVNLLKTDVSYICSLASVCNVHDFVKSICNPKITRKFNTEKNSNFERFTITNSSNLPKQFFFGRKPSRIVPSILDNLNVSAYPVPTMT